MELLKTQDAATVTLFDLRLSESEVEDLALAARYLLENLADEQLFAVLVDEERRELGDPTETREFLESTFRELMTLLQDHCRPEFLPKTFREWRASPKDNA